ncbi:MAG: NlpC/P60 family protein [Terrimicrobiaceae bacterium]|nr:NlpC/P60 family protein [Terrimicrobiaceae bacterium]
MLFGITRALVAQDGGSPKADGVQRETGESKARGAPAIVTALDPSELKDFDANPAAVRALIENGLALTKQNLGYRFGSSDPAAGGMDCSGTIFHLLRSAGISEVPRTASGQYVWARKADKFEAVVSRRKDSFELDALRPGDLLFWSGTYSTGCDPPVTHTMIYLGELKGDGRRVMFGSSDGRTFGGKKMWGVSVFDFTISSARSGDASGRNSGSGGVFIGYAHIPGLSREEAEPGSPAPIPVSRLRPGSRPQASPGE